MDRKSGLPLLRKAWLNLQQIWVVALLVTSAVTLLFWLVTFGGRRLTALRIATIADWQNLALLM